MDNQAVRQYVKDREKSPTAAFIIALFLGPFGLLYVNLTYGAVLIVICLLGWATVFVPVICWILSMIDAPFSAKSYNRKLESEAALLSRS